MTLTWQPDSTSPNTNISKYNQNVRNSPPKREIANRFLVNMRFIVLNFLGKIVTIKKMLRIPQENESIPKSQESSNCAVHAMTSATTSYKTEFHCDKQ